MGPGEPEGSWHTCLQSGSSRQRCVGSAPPCLLKLLSQSFSHSDPNTSSTYLRFWAALLHLQVFNRLRSWCFRNLQEFHSPELQGEIMWKVTPLNRVDTVNTVAREGVLEG